VKTKATYPCNLIHDRLSADLPAAMLPAATSLAARSPIHGSLTATARTERSRNPAILGGLNFQTPSHGGNRKNLRHFTIGFHARREKNHKGGGNEPEVKFRRFCKFHEENVPFTSVDFRRKNFSRRHAVTRKYDFLDEI
jgi:hypothetical protein